MNLSEMDAQECRALLAISRVGRLGCTRDGMPYVVPISFVYDDGHIYSFSLVGHKVLAMRGHPQGVSGSRRDPFPEQLVERACLRPLRGTVRNWPLAQ